MGRKQRTLVALALTTMLVGGGCSRQVASDEPAPATGQADRAASTPQASDNANVASGEPGKGGEGRTVDQPGGGRASAEGRGEHDRDRQGGAGEETGSELALHERYDRVRNGVQLILEYDAQSNTFRGAIENTTDKPIEGVRVEVHLSNGLELGPTARVTLAPREKRTLTLTPTTRNFDRWTAHAEVGPTEHGG